MKETNNSEDAEIQESGEAPVKAAPYYPQVCSECHKAWLENRYQDVGNHRKSRAVSNQGCLLWQLTHIRGSDGLSDEQELITSVDALDLAQDPSATHEVGSVDWETGVEDRLNIIHNSETENEELIERNDKYYEATTFDSRHDGEDVDRE